MVIIISFSVLLLIFILNACSIDLVEYPKIKCAYMIIIGWCLATIFIYTFKPVILPHWAKSNKEVNLNY